MLRGDWIFVLELELYDEEERERCKSMDSAYDKLADALLWARRSDKNWCIYRVPRTSTGDWDMQPENTLRVAYSRNYVSDIGEPFAPVFN